MLSSVELQVLTGSCFKLRTVHNIPVTSNKDGERSLGPSATRRCCGELGEPCSGTLPVQGTATHQVALPEQIWAARQRDPGWQRGAGFGVSPVATRTGQDQSVFRARLSQLHWDPPSGLSNMGDRQ